MMPLKPFSVLLFCHVWITVMLCLLVLQNTSLNLQKVQNHAARLVFRCSKFDHVTPLLHSLHWLPVHLRIDYKISSLCFKVLESTAPSYLSDLLHVYTPPGNFVLHLMIDFSVFLTSEQSRMVNALLLIRELTPGTSSHSLLGIRSL